MSKLDQEMLDMIDELNQMLEGDEGFDYLNNVVPDLPFEKCTEKAKSEGEICIKCKEVYPMAEPNRPDGSFKCYSCRNR